MLDENFYDSIVYGDSSLTDVFTNVNVNTSTGWIFLCSYAVALFRYVNRTGNVACFHYDSHCRNSRGIKMGNQTFRFLLTLITC